MKLWTLQHRDLDLAECRTALFVPWDCTPENWRIPYRWMTRQWIDRIGPAFDSAPIWCWHSCNGKHRSPPTVGTASLLLGDWEYHAPSTVLIEINVPEHLCLLSSYTMWNDAIDDFFENRRDSIDNNKYLGMFDAPLIKHSDDDIQAVIPHVMPDWIQDVRDLPEFDNDWDHLL